VDLEFTERETMLQQIVRDLAEVGIISSQSHGGCGFFNAMKSI
jgi:hypothetical protein